MAEKSKSHAQVGESGPQPFLCVNCGKEIAKCDGGDPGEVHVWCISSTGHCKCPHCDQEYYEISHTHGYAV